MHTRTHIHSVFGYLVFFPRLTQDCSRFYTTEPLGITRQVFPPQKKQCQSTERNSKQWPSEAESCTGLILSWSTDYWQKGRRWSLYASFPAPVNFGTITEMSRDISVGLVYEP